MRIRSAVVLLLAMAGFARGQTTREVQDQSEFAPFGTQIIAPRSWHRMFEDAPNAIAKWAVPNAVGQYTVMVLADLHAAKGMTLQKYTSDLATKAQAHAEAVKDRLGDEAAWQIDYPVSKSHRGLVPVRTLVAFHGDYFYRVTSFADLAGAEAPADARAALEQLRRGWKFCPMTRPSECVSLRQAPLNCWNLMTFRPPATFRLRAPMPKNASRAIQFQIFNYRSGLADMVANVGINQRPPHLTLEQIGQSLVEQTGFHEDPNNPVRWDKLKGNGVPGIISSNFDGARSAGHGVPMCFALLKLNPKDVVLCIFVFPTGVKDDQVIFKSLAESMSKTFKPITR